MTDIADRKEGEAPGFQVAATTWLAQMFFSSRAAMISSGISIIGIIVLSVLGFALDMSYFILALMVLFLVLPMIVAFLFFVYGMKSINSVNMSRHSITENESGLTIEIYAKEGEHAGDSDKETYGVRRHLEIPPAELGRRMTGFGGLWVEVKRCSGSEWLLLKPEKQNTLKE